MKKNSFTKTKIFALLLTIAVFVAAFVGCAKDEDNSAAKQDANLAEYVDFVVNIESGRSARVLQLTDPQAIDNTQLRPDRKLSDVPDYQPNKQEQYSFRYMRYVIEMYQPDLIIMTGDLIYGEFDDNGSLFVSLIEFMEGFDIPWAPVFGNHENESAMGADWQCQQLEEAKNCLFKQNNLPGNGNYSVGLVQDGKLIRVFYMMDSNGCSNASAASIDNGHTYKQSGFANKQVNWALDSIADIKELDMGTKYSAAYHIQQNMVGTALGQYIDDITVKANYPVILDDDPVARAKGDFGIMYSNPSQGDYWDQTDWVTNKMIEAGIDSFFMGHYHSNAASITYNGVRFQFGLKSTVYDSHLKYLNGVLINDHSRYFGSKGYVPVVGGTKIEITADGSIGADTGNMYYDASWGF